MSKRSKRLLFFALYLCISSALVFLIGTTLRSGFEHIGDGRLFVFRDGLLFFLILLVFVYVSTLALCAYSIRLPTFDYIGRIIVTNVVTYTFLGFLLSFLRIPLYSRTIIVSVFIASTVFVFAYCTIRNRLFPTLVGITSGSIPSKFDVPTTTTWQNIEGNNLIQTKFDVVITDLDNNYNDAEARTIAELRQRGYRVYDRNQFLRSLTGRFVLKDLSLKEFENINRKRLYLSIKRIIDLAILLSFLPLLIPLCIVISIIVYADSKGPVLFKQNRIGYHGRSFLLFKFRTMNHLESTPMSRFASVNDSRITRVGHFLRYFRLDELPQFWNVLKGDMSVIGPRPEQLEFVERFQNNIPFYNYRHSVRPGITGWAQVMSGYADNEHKTRIKLEYDFFYIKNQSLWLELVIMFKTISTVFLGRGAR